MACVSPMIPTDRGDTAGVEGHSSLAQAVNQLKTTVYAVCDKDTVVHDVTTWVHNCLVGRKRGCVWVLSDPYIQLVVDQWRGAVNDHIDHVCPMYRHIIIECIRGEQQLRYVPASSPFDRIRDVGLRAPSCLDTRQRMGITRSVGKEWTTISRPFDLSARFVVVNEYTWLHLPVPIDILRYRVHLAAPSGWWSNNEIPKMVLTKNPIDGEESDCEQADNDTIQSSFDLRPTSDILEYLRSHLNDKERSILCGMHLVSMEHAYDCMEYLYGKDRIDIEECMHAHFECIDDVRGDGDNMATPPSHLRLRRTGIRQFVNKDTGGPHTPAVAFSLISLTFGSPRPEEGVASGTCMRYRRLLYMARLVYCSQSFRVRYQAVSMDMGHLFLPFAQLYGMSTPVHSIGNTTVVLSPFGWPIAVRLDHDATIPSVVWCEDTKTLSHEEVPCRLHPGSNVRDIEEVYKTSLFLWSMKESLGLQIGSNDNTVSLLTIGGRFANGEDSIQHQHLCLVILLLVTCPLCYLDEAVSVATVVLSVLVGDSRTFHVSQLPYLREAHMRAWIRYWENANDDQSHQPTPVGPLRQADARQHEDAVATTLLHHPDDRRAFRRPIVENAKNNTVTGGRKRAAKPFDPTTTHRGRYRCCNVPKEYLARLHHASTMLKELSRTKKKPIILDGDDRGFTQVAGMVLADSPRCKKKTNRKKVYQCLVSRTEDALKYRLARQRCRPVTL